MIVAWEFAHSSGPNNRRHTLEPSVHSIAPATFPKSERLTDCDCTILARIGNVPLNPNYPSTSPRRKQISTKLEDKFTSIILEAIKPSISTGFVVLNHDVGIYN